MWLMGGARLNDVDTVTPQSLTLYTLFKAEEFRIVILTTHFQRAPLNLLDTSDKTANVIYKYNEK